MSEINKVMLTGRLDADPVYYEDNKVTTLRVTTTEVITRHGQKTVHEERHTLKVFGDDARVVALAWKAGDFIYAEGHIRTSPRGEKQIYITDLQYKE